MKCPKCSNVDTKVIDSRIVENNETIRRRRECEYCKTRFTTFERRSTIDLMVEKRDWTKEVYDRTKLKKAILLAFAKRKISSEIIENLLNNLESDRFKVWPEIQSIQIWKDVLNKLKEIDIVPYLRFASVYLNFDTLQDFQWLIGK